MKDKKPILYHRYDYDGLICFECDTDFSRYEYAPSLTLYKIGWFRDHQKEVVVKLTDIMKPESERHKYTFNIPNEEYGLKLINDYIKKIGATLEYEKGGLK